MLYWSTSLCDGEDAEKAPTTHTLRRTERKWEPSGLVLDKDGGTMLRGKSPTTTTTTKS